MPKGRVTKKARQTVKKAKEERHDARSLES